jgi:hypothetical protein
MELAMKKKFLALAAAPAALAVMATPAVAAVNIVVNGGFEDGNTGFTSNYTYVAPGSGPESMVPESTYSVGQNAGAYHPSWSPVTAFEGSNFFIANGSTTDNLAAWKQTLHGLTVGTTYDFSAYAVNVCCNATFTGPNASPFIIAVGAGGTPSTIAMSGALASNSVWTQFTGSFVATAEDVDLSIFTDINAASGNDYGLDAISVTQAVPEPTTWLMMILGFFGLSFAIRRGGSERKTRMRFA